MKKILKIILLLLIIVSFVAGGAYYWIQNKQHEKEAVQRNAKNQLALLVTNRASLVYDTTSSGMQNKTDRSQFIKQFSSISTNMPSFLPGKLVFSGGRYYYYQRVEDLPKTAGGRTNADFTLEYVNEKGWKLHAVTIK